MKRILNDRIRRGKFLLPVFLAAIILISGSCRSTHPLTIEILVPAENVIPAGNNRFTVVNKSLWPDSLDRTVVADLLLANLANRAARECIIGLTHVIETSGFADTILIRDLAELDSSSIKYPINWWILDTLAGGEKGEVVIGLEYFIVTAEEEGEMITGDLFMGAEMNLYYSLKLSLGIHSLWRIYHLPSRSIHEEYWARDTVKLSSTGVNLHDAMANLPDLSEVLLEAAYFNGYDYGRRLVPFWVQVNRFYYKSGSAGIREGHKLALQNRWLDAARVWRQETTRSNKLIASRAMYNMAVASEVQDQLQIALDWALKSYYLVADPAAKKYIDLLSERITERKRLEEQF